MSVSGGSGRRLQACPATRRRQNLVRILNNNDTRLDIHSTCRHRAITNSTWEFNTFNWTAHILPTIR